MRHTSFHPYVLIGLFLTLMLGVPPVFAATGDLVVVAGTGASANLGDNGLALDAAFIAPTDSAMYTDVDGNAFLYVVDRFAHVVRRVDMQTGIITRVAGSGVGGFAGDGGDALQARLYFPSGIAVDADGNLYIADTYNYRIRRVDAQTGVISTVAGVDRTRLFSPTEVEVDPDGNLLVLDTPANRVRRIDVTTGEITNVAGNGSAGFSGDGGSALAAQLFFPLDVAVDAKGNVLIADSQNHRIRRVDVATGTIETIVNIPTDPNFPGLVVRSISVDGDGNLFLALTQTKNGTAAPRGQVLRVNSQSIMERLYDGPSLFQGLSIGEDTHLYMATATDRMLVRIEGVTVPLSKGNAANQLPVADAGPDRMEECLANLASPVTLDGSGSWDPDGDNLTYIWNWGVGASGDVAPTASMPLGINLVELTVDDGVSGSSTDQALVTVIDTVAPDVALGSGLVFEADHPEGVYFDLSSSGLMGDVREACGLDRVNVSPASPYPLGTTPVTVSAVDVAGNAGSAAMNITVLDTTPPALTVPDDLLDVPATGTLTPVNLGEATATDLFGPVRISNDAPKDGFPVGLTTVTWTATDANGNVAKGTQNVTVSYLWGGFLSPLGTTAEASRHEDRGHGFGGFFRRGLAHAFDGGFNIGHRAAFRAGSTIPVKFRLLLGDGTPVTGAVARLEVTPLYGAPEMVVFRGEGDDSHGHGDHGRHQGQDPFTFRFDTEDGFYHLNLHTDRSMVGSYLLNVVLDDGTSHDVEIRLR